MNAGKEDAARHEPDDVERAAAESLAAATGMTTREALEAMAFQGRADGVLDELDAILGDTSGQIWFDWSDRLGRLKIAVAGGTSPPSSPSVTAAQELLARRGLLDRADLFRSSRACAS